MSDSNDAVPPAFEGGRNDADGDAGTDAGETYADLSTNHTVASDPVDATEPPSDEVEGAVPPGYDWPTHGGYLGCLVGSIAACLVTGFFGANLFSYLYIALRWPFPVFALLTLALFVVAVVGFGRLGWRLGRRFYRYYPQPRPTWGEHDDAEAELAHVRPVRQQASGQCLRIDEPGSGAAESASAVDKAFAARPDAGEALVEGRQRQDDGRDGGHETANQAEDADQQPQRP